MRNVVELHRIHTPSKVELVLETEPSARVSADADRLRQVLNNLVENAVKYSPTAGGSR